MRAEFSDVGRTHSNNTRRTDNNEWKPQIQNESMYVLHHTVRTHMNYKYILKEYEYHPPINHFCWRAGS